MFGKTLAPERVIAIANVESSSISFSIVKIESGTHATIPLTRHAELPLEERTSGQHLFALKQRLADITKATLAEYAAKHLGRAIKRFYVIVHAPWATGSVVNAALLMPKETYISEKIIADCAAKAYANSPNKSDLLDIRQLPIMLNGYRTSHPEGKYAHQIEVAGLMSVCDPNIRNEITATIHSVIPAAQIVIHSGARAVLEALEISRPHTSDAVCLHVSGEATEVVVLRGGIVRSYAYIQEGLRTMLFRAFPGMRPEEARAAVRLKHRGASSEIANQQMEEALLKAEPVIAQAYGEGLAKISSDLRLPNAMFLIADPDIAPWLRKFFERIDFSQFTVTAQPFAVSCISASEFGSISEENDEQNGDLDVAIAASHVLREEYA